MAMLDHFEAFIVANGERLQEYDDSEFTARAARSRKQLFKTYKFVEAKSGEHFAVHFNILPGYDFIHDALIWKVAFEGNVVHSPLIFPEQYDRSEISEDMCESFSTQLKDQSSRSHQFRFSNSIISKKLQQPTDTYAMTNCVRPWKIDVTVTRQKSRWVSRDGKFCLHPNEDHFEQLDNDSSYPAAENRTGTDKITAREESTDLGVKLPVIENVVVGKNVAPVELDSTMSYINAITFDLSKLSEEYKAKFLSLVRDIAQNVGLYETTMVKLSRLTSKPLGLWWQQRRNTIQKQLYVCGTGID
ncbi:MAG: hypothetical protein Q9227_001754 [Pyrenula ochraceoflavens]